MDECERKALIRSAYEHYARGDISVTDAMVCDEVDFEYVGPSDVFPFCGPRKGKAEMMMAAQAIAAMFDMKSLSVRNVMVDGDTYSAILDGVYAERATGALVEIMMVDVGRFESGKVVWMREYWDVERVAVELMGRRLALGVAV
jgi:ketosteroid isomerase-like protein